MTKLNKLYHELFDAQMRKDWKSVNAIQEAIREEETLQGNESRNEDYQERVRGTDLFDVVGQVPPSRVRVAKA